MSSINKTKELIPLDEGTKPIRKSLCSNKSFKVNDDILEPILNQLLKVFFLEWFENENFSLNVMKKLNKLL